MQQLPYVVVTNSHINDVYNLYYDAFDTFRKVKEIKNLEDNDRLCDIINSNLKKHLTVIPKLAMGIHECEGLIDRAEIDKFMNVILKSVSLGRVSQLLRLHTWGLYSSLAFTENLSPRHRRTTPLPHRNLQLPLILPRRHPVGRRLHRRSLRQMCRQRRNPTLRLLRTIPRTYHPWP